MNDIPRTVSEVDPGVFLVLFGGLALAVLCAAVAHARRIRDVVPVAVCVGALVCALNEPIFDELGKIVYADNAFTAYTAWGRDIPLFLVVGYVPWVAGLSYVIAQLMERGTSGRTIQLIALGSFLSVTVIETLGTRTKCWTYYGEAPLKYLGVAPQMAPVPVVCGLLIYVFSSLLRGPSRLLIALVPLFALPAVYAASGMPMYVSLHSAPAKPVQYLAGVATLLFCAAIVVGATALAERWRELNGSRESIATRVEVTR
jgi:hypothetical protein